MFIDELENELNVSKTENGALGYKTTNQSIIDFNFKISSYRNREESEIIKDFKKVYNDDKEIALKYLFFIRDAREGLGERRLFKACLPIFIEDLDDRVFEWIKEYGRLDDMFIFFNTRLENSMVEWVRNQLREDMENMLNNNPISLLAKWLPSNNTSSEETRKLASKFVKALNTTKKDYRKTLSRLRKYLDVVEVKCSKNQWSKIEYDKVPSKANLKYLNAFMAHDERRRTMYLNKLSTGETKINSRVLYPYEIVNKYNSSNYYSSYTSEEDIALEEMWKALPDYVEGDGTTIVVRDGSGSMLSRAAYNTNISMLDIATSLSIYFSERCRGQFKDKFITFSAIPRLIDLSNCTSLKDKLNEVAKNTDCDNTNIEAVFNLILKIAKNNDMKQEDIPNVLIISDMEFDESVEGNSYECVSKRLFDEIEEKFKKNGYKLPKLTFWNICSRTDTIPLKTNELGVNLVSGYSPSSCSLILSDETDFYKVLIKKIMSERYKKVTISNK